MWGVGAGGGDKQDATITTGAAGCTSRHGACVRNAQLPLSETLWEVILTTFYFFLQLQYSVIIVVLSLHSFSVSTCSQAGGHGISWNLSL